MLDYAYFKDKYRLIAVDLNKEKALDADPRAIRQIVFQGVAGGNYGTLFLKNEKKQCWNSAKEQQRFCELYKWLNTVK